MINNMLINLNDVDNVLNLYGVDKEVISAVHDIPPAGVGQKSRWIRDKRYQGRNKIQVFCAHCGHYEKRSRNAYYKHGMKTGMRYCPGCAAEMEGEK